MPWPISFDDVVAARARLAPHLAPTPLRGYATLDAALGAHVLVKHENHHPTNAFKVRNALSAVSLLDEAARRRGVVAATRGNHGMGLAWAGARLGVAVTVCVPRGNNPDKNAAIRGFGATLIEEGADYDEAVLVMERLVTERGLTPVHSTNDRGVIAGAGTMTLEIVEQAAALGETLDALVIAIGGGSQAVGALVVLRERAPGVKVFGVQAEGARAGYDSWRAGRRLVGDRADTFADGLATRSAYELTFEALREGLADMVLVSDAAIAGAIRLYVETTHNVAEGAGAAGLAGALALRERLAGRTVGVVLSGANIDVATLGRVLAGAPGALREGHI